MATATSKPSAAQIKYIRGLVKHNETAKEAAVLSISAGRTAHISELSFQEASMLIKNLKGNKETRGTPRHLQFDNSRSKHRRILSVLKQLGWVKPNKKYGRVADMERFHNWLMSNKSPVKKCLMDMDYNTEVSKVIHALDQMLVK